MKSANGTAAVNSGGGVAAPLPPLGLAAVSAFCTGLLAREHIAIVGQFYLAEMVLPLLAILLLMFGRARAVLTDRLFIGFALSGLVSLLGYLLSDLVAGTDATRALKGSGRVFILVVSGLSLIVLAAHDRRLPWWFLLGLAVGSMARLVLTGAALVADWKLGWGHPLQILALAFGGAGPLLAATASAGLGAVHILLDSRIQGVLAVVVAAILLGRARRGRPGPAAVRQLVLVGTLVLAFLGGAWLLLGATADDYGERRTLSNTARFAGLEVGIEAIVASPFIGYGSWTENPEFAEQLRRTIRERTDFQSRRRSMYSSHDLFRQHSQILQAWVEGGLLGAGFFFFYGYWLVRTLAQQVTRIRFDRYYAVYLYTTMAGLWHLLMSPFGGQARLDIAVAVAVIYLVTREAPTAEKEPVGAGTAAATLPLRLRFRPADDRPARH